MGSTDETDAADAIFRPRAHPNHPAPRATFTRERDFYANTAEERSPAGHSQATVAKANHFLI